MLSDRRQPWVWAPPDADRVAAARAERALIAGCVPTACAAEFARALGAADAAERQLRGRAVTTHAGCGGRAGGGRPTAAGTALAAAPPEQERDDRDDQAGADGDQSLGDSRAG